MKAGMNSTMEDDTSNVTTGGSVPHILSVGGLSLSKIETDIPVTRNDDNNNKSSEDNVRTGTDKTEMKNFSRKKVSDESSLEENQPLKIPVQEALGKQHRGKMEKESNLDEIDLNDDEDEDDDDVPGSGERANGSEGKKAGQPNERSPVVEKAAAKFISRNGKGNSRDEIEECSSPQKSEDSWKPKPFSISQSVERTDSLEIATKDDVDAGSVYSLVMEKDFRYHFQHPVFRLFTAYFVTFCNFLIYAEDPVAHSKSECNIPVIGNDFSFVAMKWPPNAWSLLKVILWFSGTLVGLIVGKMFFHTFLFNKIFRLKMFADDKGSWMTMFLCTILFVFIFSAIYNLFLLAGGDYMEQYQITPYMGISNHLFMKAAATGTWCGDFFTAWMVTDIMLQEKLYPDFAKPVRKWWNTRFNRIILFWIVVCVSSFIVIFVIATDYINWDSLNRDFLHSNEISRAFLASFILVMDITIVMQDWDFPHFIGAIDVKLPGINTAHIRFKIPKLLKKLEHWEVHISGKWFNYGILFIVIILDLNMWKNQIFYSPREYGQYVDPEGRIHTITDSFTLDSSNDTYYSFDYRNSTINPETGELYILGDTLMNARYNGYSRGLKGMAFIPSLVVFLVFGVLVAVYGRRPKPTKENPYGGRLKKRRRKRFRSFRFWVQNAVVLTRFKRNASKRGKGTNNATDDDPGKAENGGGEDDVDSGSPESASPPVKKNAKNSNKSLENDGIEDDQ